MPRKPQTKPALNEPLPIDRLWTIHEVTVFTQMSKGSVLRAIARGDLPEPMKVGRLVRWRPDDLRAILVKSTK